MQAVEFGDYCCQTSKCKTLHTFSFHTPLVSFSIEFKITGYYDPRKFGMQPSRHRPVMCRFPLFVALCTMHDQDHYKPTLQRDRQTDRQTDRHGGHHARSTRTTYQLRSPSTSCLSSCDRRGQFLQRIVN